MGTPTPSGAGAPPGRELGAGRGWPTAPPRDSETRPHGDPGTRQAGVKGGTLCLVKKVSDDVLTEPVVFETFSVSSSRHVTVPELTFRRMTPLGRLCALWQGPGLLPGGSRAWPSLTQPRGPKRLLPFAGKGLGTLTKPSSLCVGGSARHAPGASAQV